MSEETNSELEYARKQKQSELGLRMALQQLLEPAAFERLSNIRLSNPPLYQQLASLVISAYRSGQVSGKLSEEELKKLVSRLIAQRKEPEIKFMRK